jgi:hypothetical protein
VPEFRWLIILALVAYVVFQLGKAAGKLDEHEAMLNERGGGNGNRVDTTRSPSVPAVTSAPRSLSLYDWQADDSLTFDLYRAVRK